MANDTSDLVHIEWRLLNMMAERRIRTVTELRKRLQNVGVDVSSQQIGRLVNQFPERLNTVYLRGLLTVLDCDISDLIRVHPPDNDVGIEGKNQIYPYDTSQKAKSKPKTRKSRPPKADHPKNILPPGFDD